MATYKVIQDIEAEDKLIGPLTPRQCLYGVGAGLSFWLSFILLTKGGGFLTIFTLPPGLFSLFFALPFGKDQPTEIWALAKIRFYLLPRKRIWNQSGVKELVTITVPKRVERVLTDGLSQTEVRSRLKALANTIDSRGWAIKNVNVNMYALQNQTMDSGSDRLLAASSLPQEVPSFDIQASDDMLDEDSNPIAHQMSAMIDQSTVAHRKQIVDIMNQARSQAPPQPTLPSPVPVGQPADYWFMNQPAPESIPADQTVFASPALVAPGTAGPQPLADQRQNPEELALTAKLKAKHSDDHRTSYSHLRTIQPISAQVAKPAPPPQLRPVPPVTPGPDPAILNLANNNDWNVSTLARQAEKAKKRELPPDDNEVVISLH